MYEQNIVFEKTSHRVEGDTLVIDNVKTLAGRIETGSNRVSIPAAVLAEHGTDIERMVRTLDLGSAFGFSVEAHENDDGSLAVTRLQRMLPHGVVPACQTVERTQQHGGFIVRTTEGPGLVTNAQIFDDGDWINILTDAYEGNVYFEGACLDDVIEALTSLRDARREAGRA